MGATEGERGEEREGEWGIGDRSIKGNDYMYISVSKYTCTCMHMYMFS